MLFGTGSAGAMAFVLCIWSVVGASSAPTGIDSRCAGASKSSKKMIVQGCICDRPGVVQAVYSNGTASIYPRRYCPGRGFFMSGDEAPANFCYGGTNSKQSVRWVDNVIIKEIVFFRISVHNQLFNVFQFFQFNLEALLLRRFVTVERLTHKYSPYEFNC